MSIEALPLLEKVEAIPLSYAEQLMMDRQRLSQKLGQISTELVAINQQYNECIQEMIANNEALRHEGIDARAVNNFAQTPPHRGLHLAEPIE